jgi:hypothetical protein
VPKPDAAQLTALILERPMCLECIARHTHLSTDAASRAIQMIGRAVQIHREDVGRCRACGTSAVVFSVERPTPT